MSKVKEKPISFKGEMVRAILDCKKTQTRRPVTLPRWAEPVNEDNDFEMDGSPVWPHAIARVSGCLAPLVPPYGEVGDRLWVRETWQTHCDLDHLSPSWLREGTALQYPATYDGWVSRRRRTIHMPRWASRITLEITGVRVELLRDISEEDAKAEGVEPWIVGHGWREYGLSREDEAVVNGPMETARDSFCSLWDSIHGDGASDSNPWVWVYTFRRVTE